MQSYMHHSQQYIILHLNTVNYEYNIISGIINIKILFSFILLSEKTKCDHSTHIQYYCDVFIIHAHLTALHYI